MSAGSAAVKNTDPAMQLLIEGKAGNVPVFPCPPEQLTDTQPVPVALLVDLIGPKIVRGSRTSLAYLLKSWIRKTSGLN
jgi:hypothetical protein